MKIRIKNNSIRLRLAQGEVDTLRERGVVSAHTTFPGGEQFGYSVEGVRAITTPTAVFLDNVVSVHLPEAAVQKWATTEQVTIEAEQLLGDGQALLVLVEKDFACLAPRPGEDESDLFPHPNQDAVEC